MVGTWLDSARPSRAREKSLLRDRPTIKGKGRYQTRAELEGTWLLSYQIERNLKGKGGDVIKAAMSSPPREPIPWTFVTWHSGRIRLYRK